MEAKLIMTLRIYNTMTRSKEEFTPINPGKVKMYVCGPTVYNYIHVGNARPTIVFDVVRRYLEFLGYEVSYVMNLTDVDDKLIRKAEEAGQTVPEVANRYIEAFLEDVDSMGAGKALNPRVTENIEEIVQFITGLVDKGIAYESGSDVYFRTASFPGYGKLSHKNLGELQHGIRIEIDERKENPEDFVLWKTAKPGEISWLSPWGEGRPGWHIECSAMAVKYLGETIDIHGGGQDLEFPHHECENAQSEALHGKPLANYWMHNGMLNINDEKMSKSLGNGLTAREVMSRTKPEALRFLMLSTHYRNPLNFSEESLRQAESGLERLENSLSNVRHRLESAPDGELDTEVEKEAERIRTYFGQKMDDDFNTSDAITAMFDLAGLANRTLQKEQVSKTTLERIIEEFATMDTVLGLLKPEGGEEGLLDEEIEQLIEERNAARQGKNWSRADEIRDLLTSKGILLEDTPQGLRWRRK